MTHSAWTRLRTGLANDRWALVPLRLMIGYGFAAHGFAKLARGPDAFAHIVGALGFPAPGAVAWSTTLLELVGGILVMIGAAVTPVSIPLGIIMLTAMFTVHLPYGFSSIRLKAVTASGAEFGPVGYELTLAYLSGLVALALSGPSPASIDRWVAARKLRAG